MSECRVALELRQSLGRVVTARCEAYFRDLRGGIKKVDQKKVKTDFYRVGRWESELTEQLGIEKNLFPLLSAQAPRLYSSTGRAPYPVALLKEFSELNKVACENARKRVDLMASSAATREPASAPADRFLSSRCH
jgi:hypothetical protein